MKNKIHIIFIIFILIYSDIGFSQVSINTTGAAPDNSAMLDVSSTTNGILIPRMTEVEKTAIVTPAQGLMIYQTDNEEGFYYFNGIVWLYIGNEGNNLWTRDTGNAYTFLSNTDDNVGIGISNPLSKLDVNGNIYLRGSVFSMIGEGGANHIRSYTNLNLYADFDADNSGPYSNIFFFTDGTEKMRVTYNGRVGIGTSSPNMSLAVNGNATAANYISVIPLWQAGSVYSMSNTSGADLSNCEAGFEPSIFESSGNVEVKLVIRVISGTETTTEFQLRAHNGSTETFPIVSGDSWSWGSTQTGNVVTSPWKSWSAGTNAQELHLFGWVASGTTQFNSAYLLVRPAQP